MDAAKASGASSAAQKRAFQQLRQYAAQHNRLDNARANINEMVHGAALAALTFGVGRQFGNLAVDSSAPALADGHGSAHAFSLALGSAAGGTIMNMAAQAILPAAGDFAFGQKMMAVPAEALVPQRTNDDGEAIPLSGAETALRNEIKARQQAIVNPGSMANTMAGAAAFTGAQAIRLGAELAKTEGGAAGAAAAGEKPDLGQNLAKIGFATGVSAVGGALLSSAVLAQKHNATISVPNPDRDGGDLVKLPLFVPTPSRPGVAPPWRGDVAQAAYSAALRMGNLALAGLPIQGGLAAMQRLTLPDVGVVATLSGQLTGVAAYFAGLGLIARIEGQRQQTPARTAEPARASSTSRTGPFDIESLGAAGIQGQRQQTPARTAEPARASSTSRTGPFDIESLGAAGIQGQRQQTPARTAEAVASGAGPAEAVVPGSAALQGDEDVYGTAQSDEDVYGTAQSHEPSTALQR
jgi:hypothetical protein